MLRQRDRVAVCAIMKNEGPYLAEWAAHYHLLGFDRILVYDNDSTDETRSLLAALQDHGILQGISWPSRDHKNPQTAAYEDALSMIRGDCDWALFIDADEFLVLKRDDTVWEFTESFSPLVGRVVVNWLCFGSSGRLAKGSGLVTERFVLASHPTFAANFHVKTFVRPNFVKAMGVHAPETDGITVSPGGARVELRDETFTPTVELSIAQINHYFTKSQVEYGHKARRGESTVNQSAPGKFDKYSEGLFNFHDRNDRADPSASRYVGGIRDLLAAWSAWLPFDERNPSSQTGLDG